MSGSLQLHLVRHADAGDSDAWTGPDADRPLSDKGRAQAERLGRHLAALGFKADAVLSSPKLRALETAEIVAAAVGRKATPDDRLAEGVDVASLRLVLEDAGGPRRPIVVGHDPAFSDLVQTLTGADAPMKKGALARIDVDGEVAPNAGMLRWLLPPDALRR